MFTSLSSLIEKDSIVFWDLLKDEKQIYIF